MSANTEKPVVHFKGTANFRQWHSDPTTEVAKVFALDHPRLGCMPVRTSKVVKKFKDGSFETLNTIYKPGGSVNINDIPTPPAPDTIETEEDLAKAIDFLMIGAKALTDAAAAYGFALTINKVPRLPLAMGNWEYQCELSLSHCVYRGE